MGWKLFKITVWEHVTEVNMQWIGDIITDIITRQSALKAFCMFLVLLKVFILS